MKSPSHPLRQQWAIIRRYFTVMLRYPIRSLLRVVVWPALILGPSIYIVSLTKQDSYKSGFSVLYIAYLILCTTLFHIYSIVDSLVTDKATGMKSLMLSMGLSRVNYYFAMAICLTTLLLPIMLTVLTLTMYLLDGSVSFFTILVLFLLFILHLDALIAASVSFMTSPSYSFLVPVLLPFGMLVLEPLCREILKSTGKSWSQPILFIISFSPYEVIKLFFNTYYASSHKESLEDGPEYLTQPVYLLFVSQVFWILFFRLFAYWFEEVCPWKNVSAVRNFCFCLTGKREKHDSEIDSSLETPSQTSKYFEHRPHEFHAGIRVSHVTKTYNNQAVVKDVSFSIYRGETTLLLGHNGAGKTTLMSIILGLIEPNDGYVKFKAHPGASSVGVCPQMSILDDDLTIRQHLDLFNDIKSSISGNERDRHIHQTIADVSLTGQESKLPPELSGGMRRKLSLAIAFVGKSDVLILDEPSSGLDPDSRVFVWNAIRRYRSDRTVLLSTQHMEEADYLGDRIAIMSAGQIVCCGSSVYLNKLFGSGYKLRIECRMSKRQQILDHIRKHYFDAVQPTEVIDESQRRTSGDPIVDLALELKMKDKNKDSELELIKLLEDFENNSESLSIRSYGLKSSTIEDVMLNTSKYFASDPRETTQLLMTTTGQISALINAKNKSVVSLYDLLWAMAIKHLQIYRANCFSVLLLKIALPIIEVYFIMHNIKYSVSVDNFWQSPHLAMLTGHLIYFPVREKVSKFKIVQTTSNATILVYWTAQMLFDLLWMMIPIIAINICTASMITPRVKSWEIHGLITLATICFYLSSMFLCYCLSNVINNARSSIGYLFVISATTSAIWIVITLFRLAFLELKGAWMHTVFNYVGIFILPTDAFAYFLNGLPSACYVLAPPMLGPCIETSGISPVAISFIAMCIQMVLYLLLLFLIECRSVDIEWYCRIQNIISLFKSARSMTSENREIDRDVVEETAKALTAIKDVNSPYALVAAQLSKCYIANNKIIDGLSFTVNKGECFGLLGVNGAGKTTTFSMLATETRPYSGRILANGIYSDENLHEYRKRFGYDPQASPEMSLTPYQALSLMARLRGVDETSIPLVVKSVLDLLDMSQHTNKNDSKLSGGTKRKLALGMALIGNPTILALDEPTAGVDPLARRSAWQLLKSLRLHSNTSIIISSHAMEECEAICDRITIMASGRLRCIGTFLHLRSKFAKGCTLRVQFSRSFINSSPSEDERHHNVSNHDQGSRTSQTGTSHQSSQALSMRRWSTSSLAATDKIVDELQQALVAAIGPSVFSLADKNVNSVTFNITDNRVRRSILFRMMRDFRQKHPSVSYMINDSSLEDIFISLAREQQDQEQLQQIQPA